MKRHGLQRFMVRRNLGIGLASWCHCPTALGNPELSGPTALPRDPSSAIGALVGPGFAAPECEIVGIGGLPARRLLRLDHLIGDALAPAIGNGILLGIEAGGPLLPHF